MEAHDRNCSHRQLYTFHLEGKVALIYEQDHHKRNKDTGSTNSPNVSAVTNRSRKLLEEKIRASSKQRVYSWSSSIK
jgi:hypothetical protein